MPAQRWPAYQNLIQKLQPSNYYRSCKAENIPTVEEKTMLCYHPHGVFSGGFSWNGAFHPQLGSKISWLVAPVLFNLPIFNDIISWMGYASVGKQSMQKRMKSNESVALLPGGFHEVAILKHGVETLYVPFGFIKMALRYGYTIIPAYTFGETKAYWTKNLPQWLQRFLVRHKLPAVLFWGKFIMLPNNDIDVCTVFGTPIKCPNIEEPSREDVSKYRKMYIEALKRIGKSYGEKMVVVKSL